MRRDRERQRLESSNSAALEAAAGDASDGGSRSTFSRAYVRSVHPKRRHLFQVGDVGDGGNGAAQGGEGGDA